MFYNLNFSLLSTVPPKDLALCSISVDSLLGIGDPGILELRIKAANQVSMYLRRVAAVFHSRIALADGGDMVSYGSRCEHKVGRSHVRL